MVFIEFLFLLIGGFRPVTINPYQQDCFTDLTERVWSSSYLTCARQACHANNAQFRRVIARAPGINASHQWPNAKDTISLKQQRHTGAAYFVRSGTIENNIAVAWNLVLACLHFLHGHVPGAANQRRVPFKFSVGPQVQNDGRLPGFQFLMQLVHSDARHPQLLQEALSLVVLVAEVKRSKPGDYSERAAAETGERGNDLLQLAGRSLKLVLIAKI